MLLNTQIKMHSYASCDLHFLTRSAKLCGLVAWLGQALTSDPEAPLKTSPMVALSTSPVSCKRFPKMLFCCSLSNNKLQSFWITSSFLVNKKSLNLSMKANFGKDKVHGTKTRISPFLSLPLRETWTTAIKVSIYAGTETWPITGFDAK